MKLLRDLKTKNIYFYNTHKPKKFLNIFFSDGTSAIVFYRIQRFFKKIRLGFLGWFFIEINKVFNGCMIGSGAEMDEGFVIMHPFGIVINSKVKAGKNLVLESGVVIGAARNGMPVEVPVLGDNVFIGAGAKVLGGIKIGNNVKIGANAVVLHDVFDNATVVGVPAHVVKIG